MTPTIFVSYRRADAPAHAGRLYDRLVDRFGGGHVFIDVESLAAGADFATVIEQTLDRCDSLIAVIGPNWAPARLAGEHDWVRFEIARALERDIRVVPVLVGGAELPDASTLPADLGPLAGRQATPLSDAAWNAGVAALLESLAEARQGTPGVDWTGGVREVARIAAGHALNLGLHDVAFSPDGNTLAIVTADGGAALWELPGGRKIIELEPRDRRWAGGVAFSADGRVVAVAKRGIQIWTVPSGHHQLALPDARGVAVSADGALIATARGDDAAHVHALPDGDAVARLEHVAEVRAVAFSPKGRRLATASDDKSARVWELPGGGQLARLDHDHAVAAVALHDDGSELASASGRSAFLWDVYSGRRLARLDHLGSVSAVAFSPDGYQLATASSDMHARVWDLTTGREAAQIPHSWGVKAVAFHPGGHQIATAGSGGEAIVWEAQGPPGRSPA